MNSRGSVIFPMVRTVSSCGPCGMRPAGSSTFCCRSAAATSVSGDVERPHDVGIETHLDLAVGAADELHLADAADALEPLLDLLVGDLA